MHWLIFIFMLMLAGFINLVDWRLLEKIVIPWISPYGLITAWLVGLLYMAVLSWKSKGEQGHG